MYMWSVSPYFGFYVGVLVHYVGETGRRRGVRLHAGVMKRLHRAGFVTEYHKNLRCVRAVKI
jgi:predicted methyltransferase